MRGAMKLVLFTVVTWMPWGFALVEGKAADRPNVIIVLSDDQGYGDFSCHGNPILRTPHLDRLHARSVRLTDFHVAPMCTPTRGQLLSGRDALDNFASSVCAGRSFIRRGIPIMPEFLARAGYQTGIFGKWHLGDSYPNLPHQRGFHEAVYHLGWGITSMADTWLNDCFDGRFFHNGKLRKYPGYCTDVWFDLAMAYMRQQQKDGKPFFVYLPTNAPHGPHWVAEKYQQAYKNRGPAAFFGMLANLDENMGRLDSMLNETGLRDNTLLIYLHDNGGTAGVKTFNAGMRGHKTTYYEGGHRAACFACWPQGITRAPGDIPALTHVQDLLPTLLDICQIETPQHLHFDGVSLAKLWRGETDTIPDRVLVVQYGQRPVKWDCAVLWKRWRYVLGKELYDLNTDPGQQHDVAEANPAVVARMRQHYENWWTEVEPRLEDFNPISVGAVAENPVCLSAADWANVYCDNMQQLRQGVNKNGPWHIKVEQNGDYEIGLRRWPRAAMAPIAAGVPAFKAVVGGLPPGKALPIVKARLKVGNLLDATTPVKPDDQEVTFRVRLQAGTEIVCQSWFYDAAGQELSGAYFAYITRQEP